MHLLLVSRKEIASENIDHIFELFKDLASTAALLAPNILLKNTESIAALVSGLSIVHVSSSYILSWIPGWIIPSAFMYVYVLFTTRGTSGGGPDVPSHEYAKCRGQGAHALGKGGNRRDILDWIGWLGNAYHHRGFKINFIFRSLGAVWSMILTFREGRGMTVPMSVEGWVLVGR